MVPQGSHEKIIRGQNRFLYALVLSILFFSLGTVARNPLVFFCGGCNFFDDFFIKCFIFEHVLNKKKKITIENVLIKTLD